MVLELETEFTRKEIGQELQLQCAGFIVSLVLDLFLFCVSIFLQCRVIRVVNAILLALYEGRC